MRSARFVSLARSVVTLLGILALASVMTQAQKKPFTIADLYRVTNVGDPQMSPDGKWVAFVATTYDLAKGKSNADIYLTDLGGGKRRKIAASAKSDYHPRWSPDGSKLLFVSTRDGAPQAYVLNMDMGGEAVKVTSLSGGAGDPEWAGEDRLVFSSDVFPEYGTNDEKNKRDDDAMEKGPVQAHMADTLLYRHWTSYRDGKVTHLFSVEIEGGKVVDLTPGKFNCPRFSLGGRGFAVSPDGKEVCYVSNHDPDPWSSTNGDLFIVPVTGGASKNITDENEGFDGEPIYDPSSKKIAFVRQLEPRFEADRFRLAVYDKETGKSEVLTEDFDYWVSGPTWSADGEWIYFTSDYRGNVPLFRIAAGGGEVAKVMDVKTISGFTLSPDGKWAVVVRKSVGEPPELYRSAIAASGSDLYRITKFNHALEQEVDIRPAESMWIEGAKGKQVHVFIVKPHDFDPAKKYPLILNVRGGPQGMWADSFRGDWQVYPGSGYIVAFPNPTGSTGYGQELTAAVSKDWGGEVYGDLMKVTDALAELPYVDSDRMGAMGWSYGGYMMMWFQGHTTKFKALAAMMGVYDLRSMYSATEELWFVEWDLGGTPWGGSDNYEKFSPSNFVKNFKTPCLVIAGERDYRVPYTQSIQYFTDLQKMKVPSRLIVFKNDGHWPSYVKSMPLYYNAHLDWFHRYLGGAAAPYDMTKMVRNRAFEGRGATGAAEKKTQ